MRSPEETAEAAVFSSAECAHSYKRRRSGAALLPVWGKSQRFVSRPFSRLWVNLDVRRSAGDPSILIELYGPWQPHFRENLCLEVASFLIFNVSPGAPRQHMFAACPQDMAA
ncbi:unnamed protein product [Pleuronectes platessa]|uniref:Uncharacterized protein n=1 Tax=Pleuronectes platessa TaxID=8262 RepID=A0A9N7ZC91_PLEPL|nr:unnamed protein product [Pleuronectes platessa]